MKVPFLLFHVSLSVNEDRGIPERYLYDTPKCASIQDCAGQNGCDGMVYTAATGTISVSNYGSDFSCRWEIQAPAGTKIEIRVQQGAHFGIENQSSCGYDRLHIRSSNDEGYGRLCSSAANSQIPYNGMAAQETFNGNKIQSKLFREWLTLDTAHLVIAFDSDRQQNEAGFQLEYRMDLPPAAIASVVRDDLLDDLKNLVTVVSTKPNHANRLTARLDKFFLKFTSRMQACKNGDQLVNSVPVLDTFVQGDYNQIENVWLSFFGMMFDDCDIFIISKHGNFANTSWPRRIGRWMDNLVKHL